jgi:hypothetical protein
MPLRTRSYWQLVRSPRYSLVFAFPLLVSYELLAFALSHDALEGVRNGADVLLKSLFILLGGRFGLVAFGLALIGTGGALVWRDRRRAGPWEGRIFAGMALESTVYAFLFGGVTSALTGLLLNGSLAVVVGQGSIGRLDLATQLMVSLGAGIYEELLFRVLLVSFLARGAALLFGWRPLPAGVFAAGLGALIFAAFHYVGPYGDPPDLGSFVFRTVAGLLLSGLFLLRGFGITAWTHALYDVFLALGP